MRRRRDRRRYDALLHSWLVFLGYGAVLENGELPIDLFPETGDGGLFEIEQFRKHRNYNFGLSHVKNRGEEWSLHIFDARTMWEVGRL